MKRTSPHVIIAIIAGAVIILVVTALILCPPDRINQILEWFRIVTGTVGYLYEASTLLTRDGVADAGGFPSCTPCGRW